MNDQNSDSVLQNLLLKYVDQLELDKLISNYLNLDYATLRELLKFKYDMIQQGKQQRVHVPVQSLLNADDFFQSNFHTDILKYVLLIQKDGYELKVFEDFTNKKLNSAFENLDEFIKVFDLLDVALSLIENNDFEINIDNADSLHNFYQRLCNIDSKQLMSLTSNTTKRLLPKISTNSFISCLEAILASVNVPVLCCVVEYFLCDGPKSSVCILLHRHNIWKQISDLIKSYETTRQRQGIYLLQQIKCYILNNSVFTEPGCDYIKLPEFNEKETESAWNSFFILAHTSREKQLHLVKPCLVFLPDLFRLNPLWVKTIHCILLSHTQNEIVSCALINVLTSEWFKNPDNFLLLYKDLLQAFSKVDYSKSTLDAFDSMGSFVEVCSDEAFWSLLEESNNISWNPINMWLYCKNILNRKNLNGIKRQTFCTFISRLQTLPHKYIRSGCMNLCLRFIANMSNTNDVSREDLLKLTVVVNGTDISFEYFSNVFKNVILKHRLTFEYEIEQFLGQKSTLNDVAITLHLWKALDPSGSFFENRGIDKLPFHSLLEILNLFDELIDKIDVKLLLSCVQSALVCCDKELLANAKCVIDKLNFKGDFKLHSDKVSHICSVAETLIRQGPIVTKLCEYELAVKFLRCFRENPDLFAICKPQLETIISTREDSLVIEVLEALLESVTANTASAMVDLLETIYERSSDRVVAAIIQNLETLFANIENRDVICKLLHISMEQILRIRKGDLFNSTLESYLRVITDVKSVVNVAPEKVFDITMQVLELSRKYTSVGHILSKHLRHFVNCHPHKTGMYINIFLECLLNDACIRKEERNEYEVCKDIYECIGEIDNDGQQAFSRYLIFESILHFINHELISDEERRKIADDFAYALLAQYKVHFNKRYFKDSVVHIRKLRILQALLLLQPCLSASRDAITTLLLASICTESHQHCVKQLIMWLLIKLLSDDPKGFEVITNYLETTVSTKVSAISGLIPVLYHLTLLSTSQKVWVDTLELLLPWTMGSNFKLRVYAQVSVQKLYEKSVGNSFVEVVDKYRHIYNCISTLFSKAQDGVQSCLQTDDFIYNFFSPVEHYSLETILISIPKINTVTSSEWEGYNSLAFEEFQTIKGKNHCNHFLNYYEKMGSTTDSHKDKSKTAEALEIVQRKITPWNEITQNKEEKKAVTNLVVVATFVDKAANIGGLSRTCEIFGVRQLVVNDINIISDKEYKSLSMCSEGWLDITEVKIKDVTDYLLGKKLKGYHIVAIEQTSNSSKLHEHKFQEKSVLVLGNEKEGIPANVLLLADVCVEIPQMGVTRSLNVHVAGSLFIWEYGKQYLFK